MLTGWDEDHGLSPYYLDYISTLHKLERGGIGSGLYFLLSLMNKYFEKSMSLEKALGLFDQCMEEVRSKLVGFPQTLSLRSWTRIVPKSFCGGELWKTNKGPLQLLKLPL